MNQWWIIFLMVTHAAVGFSCWEAATWKDGIVAAHLAEAQQVNTIKAQQSVLVKQLAADQITTNTEVDYDKTMADLAALYSVQPNNSTSNGMPSVCRASGGADAGCATKKYKMTPEQCDISRTQLLKLRAWLVSQKRLADQKVAP